MQLNVGALYSRNGFKDTVICRLVNVDLKEHIIGVVYVKHTNEFINDFFYSARDRITNGQTCELIKETFEHLYHEYDVPGSIYDRLFAMFSEDELPSVLNELT